MYTITFYSFKGGVGRTLALVNVAAQLAKMGRKVLLVDFDLEAPGLETFDRLRPPQPHPGLVEYVTEYLRTKHSPDVREYIYTPTRGRKLTGQLWVMPAGRRDANYQAALTRLNWKKLYDDSEGFLLFEDTKGQWEQEFKPDYVLIDSRTGHSDVKGICTRQLPNAVVVLFFPNEQNLVGLKAVCQEIRSEREQGLMKTIGLHFVMSNVPDLDDEDKVLQRRRQAFEKDLQITKLSAVIHRYESVMLFNQAIFVLDRPRSRLAREYRKLTRALIRHNPVDREGALQFLRRSSDDWGRGDYVLWREDLKMINQGLPAGLDLLNKITAHHFSDADVIYEVAKSERGGEGRDDAHTMGLLDQVLAVKPDHQSALYERAELKRRKGDVSGAVSDLFQHLRDHGLESPHGMSALYDLRTLAPERLLEAVDCATAKGIEPETKYRLARFLDDVNAALPRAIQYMRECITEVGSTERKSTATFFLQSYLLRTRRWQEVISLYDTKKRAGEAFSWPELLNVGMAHWAYTGSVPDSLSKELRQRLSTDKESYQLGQYEPSVDRVDGICWTAWWRGDSEKAVGLLKAVDVVMEEWVKDGKYYSCWSFWRYRGITLSEYRDDCQQLRRMIEGEPIRPPFVGDSAEAG